MTEDLGVITVEAQPPHLYLRNQPITLEQFQAELRAEAATNLDLSVAVRAQPNSPLGILVTATDDVKEFCVISTSVPAPAGNGRRSPTE